jgi:phosphoglycerate dehydrogenase-like enzyme
MLLMRILAVSFLLASALIQTAFALGDDDTIAALHLSESSFPSRDMERWRPPRKIVVLIDSPGRLRWLGEAVADTDVQLLGARTPSDFLSLIKDADAVEGLCSAAIVAADPELRWIQTQGAGVEGCVDIPRVASGDILVTNMQKVDAPNVAEHAFALILGLCRQMPALDRSQRKREWGSRLPRQMLDLDGSTMLVVGLGGNGTAIAERAHAFGMHVIATREGGTYQPPFVDYVGTPEELPHLIPQADVIVNATPLTSRTTAMFGSGAFRSMKRTALFINVGRGKSVVTADLVNALTTGQIAGAGIDVVDPEPLPRESPLWEAPNLIITPHVADRSPRRMERFWAVMRENLRRYVHGEKLLSVVDPQRGY